MTEVLVWMLISANWAGSVYGVTTVIGNFKSEAQCEHVLKSLPSPSHVKAKCIQANIYIPLGSAK